MNGLEGSSRPRQSRRTLWRWIGIALVGVTLTGCATWQPPDSTDDATVRSRAVTQAVNGLRVSAAVLSAEESRQLLGVDVVSKGVQPVWIQVENPTPEVRWLLRTGTDPDYFSPLEVAWSFHAPLASESNAALDDHLDAMAFQNPIPAHATHAGIIFTNPHSRLRLLNVDILGKGTMTPFTLFLPVPDDPRDESSLQAVNRYVQDGRDDYQDPGSFRQAVEALPCCASGEGTTGDPLNLVIVGEFEDIAAALVRRGYRAARTDLDDRQQLFGRPPDFVIRKAGQGGAPANWLRFWAAPVRFQGQPVFLGQAGRPVGGRRAVSDGEKTARHPDVDEARNLTVQDMLYSGGLAKLGFVAAGTPVDTNLATDGLRAVLFFITRPLALDDLEILDWVPYLERRTAEAAVKRDDSKP